MKSTTSPYGISMPRFALHEPQAPCSPLPFPQFLRLPGHQPKHVPDEHLLPDARAPLGVFAEYSRCTSYGTSQRGVPATPACAERSPLCARAKAEARGAHTRVPAYAGGQRDDDAPRRVVRVIRDRGRECKRRQGDK
jgi:hypothetical protein